LNFWIFFFFSWFFKI